MKNPFLFFFFLLSISCAAQGLIINNSLIEHGGFEEYTDCPCHVEYFGCTGWFKNFFVPTPYYNACANTKKYCYMGVPVNENGSQEAHSGKGYIGASIWLPDTTANLVRIDTSFHYIETQLKQPLKANTLYRFTAYVSLADSSAYAISGFPVAFSEERLVYLGEKKRLTLVGHPDAPVDYQIKKAYGCDLAFLENDTGWTKVSFTYPAKGNEKYLSFGTWPADCPYKKRELKLSVRKRNFIHYYVDDVSLVEIPDGAVAEKCRECICALKKRKDLHNTSYLLEKKSVTTKTDPELDEIAGRMLSDTTLIITLGSEDAKSKGYIAHIATYLQKKGIKTNRIKNSLPSNTSSSGNGGEPESIDQPSEGMEAVPVSIAFD